MVKANYKKDNCSVQTIPKGYYQLRNHSGVSMRADSLYIHYTQDWLPIIVSYNL